MRFQVTLLVPRCPMIDLVFKNSTKDKKYNSKFFEKVLITGIKELKLNNPAPSLSADRHSERGQAWGGAGKKIGTSINLVGEDKIKELNKKYRNKDKVTDVLSFPMNKKLEIGNWKLKIIDLGDIFICLSFAKKQAKSENISIEKELARLTVHGFLHLVGYDHDQSAKDKKTMLDLEDKILKKINFKL